VLESRHIFIASLKEGRMDASKVSPFALPHWYLSIPVMCYLVFCIIGTIALRALFFMFRAWAVQRGDFPGSKSNSDKEDVHIEPGEGWPFWQAFWECFKGSSKHKAHADLWLNAFIGFAELAAYPVLLKTGYLTVIGGWLLVKTAGSWGGWKISRTSFNRFLLNNISELAIAYLLLTRYVQVR
jgi:hypothetical protein